jgi:hypothetical protein
VGDARFEVRVAPAVHAAHPEYVALVLLASGLANGPSDADSDAQLAVAEAHLRAADIARASDHPHIAAWRGAFRAFGAKPSRYPSSAEARITRVLKAQALPRVNALVDLYNAVSVRHVVPVGARTPTDSTGWPSTRCTTPPTISRTGCWPAGRTAASTAWSAARRGPPRSRQPATVATNGRPRWR